jgi:hypothetical protein
MGEACTPSWEEMRRTLISLWDLMERFRLDKFIKAYQHAAAMNQTWLTARDCRPDLQNVQVSHGDYKEFVDNLSVLQVQLEEVGMTLSSMSAAGALAAAGQAILLDQYKVFESGTMIRLAAEIKDMQTRVRDEFVTRYVLVVPSDKVSFYDPIRPAFGAKVDQQFPSIAFEISEAGKCFGLARYTASVFHLMRVLEVGIRAVARCLSVPDPVRAADRNWGKVLQGIDGGIKQKRSVMLAPDRELFDEVYLALDKIRSLWRNTTMHVENKYTEEEAKEIWDAVNALMRKLASRLDENGAPQA